MQYYIGLIVGAVVLFCADIVAIRYNEINAEKTLGAKMKAIRKMSNKSKVFTIFMFFVLVITAVLLVYYKSSYSVLMNVERLFVISLLLPAMFYDLREQRIPNKLMKYGAICRVCFIVPEIFLEKEIVLMWVMEAVAVVLMFVIAIAILLIYEEAFGMGDIKLLAVLGSYLGISGLFVSMFYTSIVSGVVSVMLLLFKKKKLKDTLKFAPYIVVGTMLAVFVFGV